MHSPRTFASRSKATIAFQAMPSWLGAGRDDELRRDACGEVEEVGGAPPASDAAPVATGAGPVTGWGAGAASGASPPPALPLPLPTPSNTASAPYPWPSSATGPPQAPAGPQGYASSSSRVTARRQTMCSAQSSTTLARERRSEGPRPLLLLPWDTTDSGDDESRKACAVTSGCSEANRTWGRVSTVRHTRTMTRYTMSLHRALS
jgi:hypothetical protein